MAADRLSNMPFGVKDGSPEGNHDGLRRVVSAVRGSGTGLRDASCADGEYLRAREARCGVSPSCAATIRTRAAVLHVGRFDKPGGLSSFGKSPHRVPASTPADYRVADGRVRQAQARRVGDVAGPGATYGPTGARSDRPLQRLAPAAAARLSGEDSGRKSFGQDRASPRCVALHVGGRPARAGVGSSRSATNGDRRRGAVRRRTCPGTEFVGPSPCGLGDARSADQRPQFLHAGILVWDSCPQSVLHYPPAWPNARKAAGKAAVRGPWRHGACVRGTGRIVQPGNGRRDSGAAGDHPTELSDTRWRQRNPLAYEPTGQSWRIGGGGAVSPSLDVGAGVQRTDDAPSLRAEHAGLSQGRVVRVLRRGLLLQSAGRGQRRVARCARRSEVGAGGVEFLSDERDYHGLRRDDGRIASASMEVLPELSAGPTGDTIA